jgi:hypothetical protein
MCDGGERELLPDGRRPRVRTTPSHCARPSPTPETDRALGPANRTPWRLRCPDRGSQDNVLAAARTTSSRQRTSRRRVCRMTLQLCSGELKARDDSALGRFWAEVLGWGVSSVGHTSEGARSDHRRRGPRTRAGDGDGRPRRQHVGGGEPDGATAVRANRPGASAQRWRNLGPN